MNLLSAIHSRWEAATALNDLLPVERLYTGASAELTPPFAVLSKQCERPDSYQSDGSAIDVVALRIRVFHSRCDAAERIIHEIKKSFDRTSFDLADGDKVLNMQRTNDYQAERRDGLWELVIDFKCTVFLALGV